jgi:hypothetical protein
MNYVIIEKLPSFISFFRVFLQIHLESWAARIYDFFRIRIHYTYSLFRSASEAGERRAVIEEPPKPRNGCDLIVLTPSVADPDPGSGIGCFFDPWIRDPGWEKVSIRIRDPG